MSKIGIQHRIDNLRNTLEQVDPRALAIHRMPDDLRRVYDRWLGQCERAEMYAEREHGANGMYAAMMDGTLDEAPMPSALRDYLDVPDEPQFAAGATLEDLSDAWRAMCEGDG